MASVTLHTTKPIGHWKEILKNAKFESISMQKASYGGEAIRTNYDVILGTKKGPFVVLEMKHKDLKELKVLVDKLLEANS